MNSPLRVCCSSCGRPMPIGDMEFDLERRIVSRAGLSAYLTPGQLLILEWLMIEPGRPVSGGDIFDLIRQEGRTYAQDGDTLVKVMICNLREKLDPLGVRLKSLWGVGYFLEFGEPGGEVDRDARRHRHARARTAPRRADVIAVAGLVKTGMTNEEIAVECSLTLAAVRRAMAAAVEASPSSARRAAA